jgi:hypothetical protein
MPKIIKKFENLRLYAEKSESIDASYFISVINEFGLRRLKIHAPCAAYLAESGDDEKFKDRLLYEFTRFWIHPENDYSEVPFPV